MTKVLIYKEDLAEIRKILGNAIEAGDWLGTRFALNSLDTMIYNMEKSKLLKDK